MNEEQQLRRLSRRASKAKKKSEQYFISAGQHLKLLKAKHDEAGGSWADWEVKVKDRVGIGRSRASELMQIADGRKTEQETKAASAERKRIERKKKPLRDVTENSPTNPTAKPKPSNAQDQRELEAKQAHIAELEAAHEHDRDLAEQLQAAKIKIVGLEGEITDLKRENAELRAKLEAARKVAPPAATVVTPVDDGLDIPECLRRTPPPAKAADAVDSNGAAQADQ
jgi:hypothetical protein